MLSIQSSLEWLELMEKSQKSSDIKEIEIYFSITYRRVTASLPEPTVSIDHKESRPLGFSSTSFQKWLSFQGPVRVAAAANTPT